MNINMRWKSINLSFHRPLGPRQCHPHAADDTLKDALRLTVVLSRVRAIEDL